MELTSPKATGGLLPELRTFARSSYFDPMIVGQPTDHHGYVLQAVMGDMGQAAVDGGEPTTRRRREAAAAAAAASYALIAPRLPHAALDLQHKPTLPLHVLRAAANCSRPSQHEEESASPAQRTAGNAYSPIALDSSDDDSSASLVSNDPCESETSDAAAADDDDGADEVEEVEQSLAAPKVKTWTSEQFPDGYAAGYACSMSNCKAAQEWSCPCLDRRNCIGQERLDMFKLYEFRKDFKVKHKVSSMRDAMRAELQAHYDSSSGVFTRSFVVADRGDCCAAAAGLARGLSFGTFANARADVRLDRDWHGERRAQRKVCQHGAVHAPPCLVVHTVNAAALRCPTHRPLVCYSNKCAPSSALLAQEVESEQREHLEAYIRDLRSGMEGSKGGSTGSGKWFSGVRSMAKRWEDYTRMRREHGLPIVGSIHLFTKLWKAHTVRALSLIHI